MNTTIKNVLVLTAALVVPLVLSRILPPAAMVAIAFGLVVWVGSSVLMGDR